jgi:hypothetical protein
MTHDQALQIVSENGLMICKIPENLISDEICMAACRQNGRAAKWVPRIFHTEQLREVALTSCPQATIYFDL